jgi:hypothetical protein
MSSLLSINSSKGVESDLLKSPEQSRRMPDSKTLHNMRDTLKPTGDLNRMQGRRFKAMQMAVSLSIRSGGS